MNILPATYFLWTGFTLLLVLCVTSTGDWQELNEEDDIEKDIQLDGMIFADRRQILNKYDRLGKQKVLSQIAELKDNSLEDDVLVNEMMSFQSRYKRHALINATEYLYSGDDDPCNTTFVMCNSTQDCVHNHEKADGYECQCKVEYEPDPVRVCVPTPDSKRLYLTTPLNIIFNPDYNNSNSSDYQTFKLGCEESFSDWFNSVDGYKTLKVSNFRNGSTVVVYSVIFTVNVSDVIIEKVGQAVLAMEQFGYVMINTMNVTISSYTGIFWTLNDTLSNKSSLAWCSYPSLYSCDNGQMCVNTGMRYRCDYNSKVSFSLKIGINTSETILSNKSSLEYLQLQENIATSLKLQLNETVPGLVSVDITNMRNGSVIVDAVAEFSLPKESIASPMSKAMIKLLTSNFTIGYESYAVVAVFIGGKQVITECDAFMSISSSCTSSCVESNGTISCKELILLPDNGLLIGLGVGIPLFVIFVCVITFVIYVCVKKRRNKFDKGSDDGRSYTSSVFARTVPTRSPFWSPWKGVYSPDARSTTLFEEDNDGHGKRSEFDQSTWEDSDKGFSNEDAAKPSNFSWDFLYDQLDTDQTFTIKRPVLSLSTNPAYLDSQNSDFHS